MSLSGMRVVVIGAGIAGCVAAIRLKQAGFGEVVLLEQNSGICTETTATVSELHSGAEYPTDVQSGIDCLRGLIHFAQLFPTALWTQRPPTNVLISNRTEACGDITVEKFSRFIDSIKSEYVRLIRANERNEVLGSPANFWKPLAAGIMSQFDGIAGGFTTPQRGINPSYLAAILRGSIEELGIDFKPRTTVRTLEKRGNNFVIEKSSAEGQERLQAHFVVVAASHHGFRLIRPLIGDAYAEPEIIVGLRQIIIAQRSDPGHPAASTNFILEGKYGAMESPFSSSYSFVYFPAESQIETRRLNSIDYSVPEDWLRRLRTPSSEDDQRAQRILDGAVWAGHKALKNASIARSYLKIAVKGEWTSRQRRDHGFDFPLHDCLNLSFMTKATTSPRNADLGVMALLERARRSGKISSVDYQTATDALSAAVIAVPKVLTSDSAVTFMKQTAQSMGLPSSAGTAFTTSAPTLLNVSFAPAP